MIEVSSILNGTFLENTTIRFFFIILVFYILSKIVQLVIIKNLKRAAKKTRTEVDDLVIEAIKKPLIRFLILIGLKLAINVLPLSEKVMGALQSTINSIMILIVTFFLIKLTDIFLNHWGKEWAHKTKSSLDDDILPLLHKTSRVILMIIGIFFIFGEWNIDVTGLLAGVGVAGLAIGFAIKDSLANIFGGISIILDKAFKVGDVVKLDDGSTGTIKDIGLRSTRIRTWNNELLIIPNGKLANSKVQNYKQPDLSVRIEINFGVEYGSNPDKVKKVVVDCIKSIDKVIKNNKNKPIEVLFLNMGDSALEFRARFWVKDYTEKLETKEKAVNKIYKTLNKSKIGIPFPTRTIYMKK